jgi:serine/threonine protein kinase
MNKDPDPEDWKVVLSDDASKQVVLYNPDSHTLEVASPEVSFEEDKEPLGYCSKCHQLLPSESHYFKLLQRVTPSFVMIESTRIPQEAICEGYYLRFFRELEKLGKGAGGSVFHCQHVLNNVPLGHYAVKKIPIGDDVRWLARSLPEVQILSSLRKHRNVVEYKHCWIESHQPTPFGPRVPCLFMLMEYIEGGVTLDDLAPSLDRNQRMACFRHICFGIRHLHDNGILHRDIKPSNILIKRDMTALVGDFGQCKLVDSVDGSTGNTGTLEYCAPEVLTHGAHNKASDIWSLGLLLFYLLNDRLPWSTSTDPLQLEMEICNLTISSNNRLLQRMLNRDPTERPSIDEVIFGLSREASPLKLVPIQGHGHMRIIAAAALLIVQYAAIYPCTVHPLFLLIFDLCPLAFWNGRFKNASLAVIAFGTILLVFAAIGRSC